MYHVYILHCADGSYYVGHTNNLPRRIQAHTDGTAARHTRDRAPVRLVYSEQLASRAAAVHRERQIKRWARAKKEALIRGDLDTLHRLSQRHRPA
jgi:predicted GIY-YIG superfamily endonuclease